MRTRHFIVVAIAAMGLAGCKAHHAESYYKAHPKAWKAELAHCDKAKSSSSNCKAADALRLSRISNPKNNQVPSLN
jgi:hypothetical protein